MCKVKIRKLHGQQYELTDDKTHLTTINYHRYKKENKYKDNTQHKDLKYTFNPHFGWITSNKIRQLGVE